MCVCKQTWELLWPKRQQHSLPNEDRIPDMIANAARLRADIHLMFLDEQVSERDDKCFPLYISCLSSASICLAPLGSDQ